MEKRSFIMGSALVLLLAGTVGGDDEGKTKDISCTFSGTFADGVETHIDTNDDNISAGLDQGLENCNIGRFFFQEVAEYQAPVPPTAKCPAGTTEEFHLQQDHIVVTEEKTGDQIFAEVATNDATLCFKESDLTFSITAHGTNTGGTGQFAGASGTFDAQSTGKYLVFGFKNGVFGGFGQFSGTSTGTLILPKH
jgi:hypothetical protein